MCSDDQCASKESVVNTQSAFTNLSSTKTTDLQKQDLNIPTSTFGETAGFQTAKSYSTSVTGNSYSAYSCNSQTNSTSFSNSTTNCNSSNFSMAPVTQTVYSTSYTQTSIPNFSQTSTSSVSSIVYNQTPASQVICFMLIKTLNKN